MFSSYSEIILSSPLVITMSLSGLLPPARSIMRGIATSTIGVARQKEESISHNFMQEQCSYKFSIRSYAKPTYTNI